MQKARTPGSQKKQVGWLNENLAYVQGSEAGTGATVEGVEHQGEMWPKATATKAFRAGKGHDHTPKHSSQVLQKRR